MKPQLQTSDTGLTAADAEHLCRDFNDVNFDNSLFDKGFFTIRSTQCVLPIIIVSPLLSYVSIAILIIKILIVIRNA